MQELKEHYERQDTEELLDIARKDLTDEARHTLNLILASRGVKPSSGRAVREEALKQEATEAAEEGRLASRGSRLVAFAIDVWGVVFVLSVVFLPLRLVSNGTYEMAVVVVWLTYFLVRDSIPGQGLGKRFAGIRAVQLDTGKSCTWTKSFWRNLTHFFFVVDALFILGRRRMRLGDMLAHTVVVRAAVLRSGV